jgi:hypothetical protein
MFIKDLFLIQPLFFKAKREEIYHKGILILGISLRIPSIHKYIKKYY